MNGDKGLRNCVFLWLGFLVIVYGWIVPDATAMVIFGWTGNSSAGVPVQFEADMSIAGDTLTIVLQNNSPTNSLNPNDTLGSFYFDIVGPGNTRPTLTYTSATGDLYTGSKDNPDPLVQAGANLIAPSENYNWMYKAMNVAFSPGKAFGIGCVGNNNLTPNNLDGQDGVDGAIYRTEVVTQNLDGRNLVKNSATFTFTGVAGFTEAQIVSTVAFGMGTAPDSLQTGTIIPEPSGVALTFVGLILLGLLSRRRR